jgi:DNA-binding IclR family transcriptional regulator
MADAEAKSTVYSVLKACRLVECFSHAKPALTFSELVSQSSINRTTVHRLLSTLEQAGWVERINGRYRLTIRVFQIGSVVSRTLDLRAEARPLLEQLAAELGDTAYLVIVVEDKAVCLDRVEGVNPVTVTSKLFNVGQSLPLHVGAAPLTLLAFREDELLPRVPKRTLARYTSQTIVSLPKLRRTLREIRAQGYTLSIEDVVPDVCALGAPVFDQSGVAVAAISVGGYRERFQPRLRAISSAVVSAAQTLSTRLGAHPPRRQADQHERFPAGASRRRRA